jgi:predicted Zn-ribbon and HTH transcriptional regulator
MNHEDSCVFTCNDCGMTFEEDVNCKVCPDCDSTNIRESTEEEYNKFMDSL